MLDTFTIALGILLEAKLVEPHRPMYATAPVYRLTKLGKAYAKKKAL